MLFRSHFFSFVPLEGGWEPFSWWNRRIPGQVKESCSVVMVAFQVRQGLGNYLFVHIMYCFHSVVFLALLSHL